MRYARNNSYRQKQKSSQDARVQASGSIRLPSSRWNDYDPGKPHIVNPVLVRRMVRQYARCIFAPPKARKSTCGEDPGLRLMLSNLTYLY